MATNKQVEKAYNRILTSSIFRTDGEDIDLCDAIFDLCDAIENTDETDEWIYIDEGDIDLPSFLVGAYWALTEWHGGQASDTYAALCAIGSIYSPGMTDGPEPESPEHDAYTLVSEYFGIAD